MELSLYHMVLSAKLRRKPDVALLHSFYDYFFASAAHHPFEAMVAVLAHERTRFEHLARGLELIRVGEEHCGRIDAFADALPLAGLLDPFEQTGTGWRRKACARRRIHMREHRHVAP